MLWDSPALQFVSSAVQGYGRTVGQEDLVPLAPPLNVILSLDLPETAATVALEGQARALSTEQLLLGILKRDAATRSPVVVILEDAHWFDASSLRFALLVLEQIRRSSSSFRAVPSPSPRRPSLPNWPRSR